MVFIIIRQTAKLGTNFIVSGSQSIVDVINIDTGKIVHVFETKKDRIKSLSLLVCRGSRLFLLAEEDKNSSVISISLHF